MSNKKNKNYYRYSIHVKYAALYVLAKIMHTNFESISHKWGKSQYKF